MVDPSEIGAAGHSNGAITTLGLVANSCCRDTRVKAAVVMAGTTEGLGQRPLPIGRGASASRRPGPPRRAGPLCRRRRGLQPGTGPKALLALDWDSSSDPTGSTAHMAASGVVGPTSSAVIKATTAFFDAFLKHEPGALQAVAADGRTSLSAVHTAWAPGSEPTLPSRRLAAVHLHASVTPRHESARRPGRHRPMERLHGGQGGQHPRVLPCGHRNGQLGRLQLRPRSDPAP